MLVPLRAMYTQAFVAVEGIHSVMGKYGVQVSREREPCCYVSPLKNLPAPTVTGGYGGGASVNILSTKALYKTIGSDCKIAK